MGNDLDELLGIDTNDPIQTLALELVEADDQLLRRLVEVRKEKGLTQEQVGQRMGVTQPAVAAFERADADPKLSTVRRYALAIGARVRHIVTDGPAASSPSITSTTRPTTRTAEGHVWFAGKPSWMAVPS